MLARIRKAQEEKDSGFTLIELLVVMIIIGILAAIAIPAFLSQKNKAKSTSAKADVSAMAKEITAHFVDNGPLSPAQTLTITAASGTTPASWTLGTTGVTGKLSNNNTAAGSVTSENVFCVAVWNTDVEGTGTIAAAAAGAGSIFKFQPGVGITKGNCP